MDVFPIVPAATKTIGMLAALCALLAAITILLGWVAYSSQHASVTVTADKLILRGDLWGRSIPMTAINLSLARVVDLASDSGLEPVRRRLGSSLPGYSAGWFRLANGNKALIYLTDQSEAAYLPTTEGYDLLLSVEDPQALISRLGGDGS